MEAYLDQWIAEQKRVGGCGRKPFVGARGYNHFDSAIGLNAYVQKGELRNELVTLSVLKMHKYWPLIRRDHAVVKYEKNNGVISKKKKSRPIMYAAHRDAVIFSFYAFILKKVYESKIKDSRLADEVVAYRKIPAARWRGNKSNIDFANEVFKDVRKSEGDYIVFCFDVSGFFDNMSHDILMGSVRDFLKEQPDLMEYFEAILKPILKYRYVFMRDAEVAFGGKNLTDSRKYNRYVRNTDLIHKNKKRIGIPQGSPISDILSNVYMYRFDTKLSGVISDMDGAIYRRYCDDILIMVPMNRANEVCRIVGETMRLLKLELSDKKTEAFYVNTARGVLMDVTDRYAGRGIVMGKNRKRIQYLGFEFDLKNIHIRAKSISNLYRRVRLMKRNKRRRKNNDSAKRRYLRRKNLYCYNIMAAKKINNECVRKQNIRIRRRTKKMLEM